MKSWVEQPGFPVLEVGRADGKLVVSQRRFTCLDNESRQEWLIPLTVEIFLKNGDSEKFEMLLDTESAVIDLPQDTAAYKFNEGQKGFYRVRYLDRDNLAELGKRAAERVLSPVDRWGIQGDLYAMVKAGLATMGEFLTFATHYSREKAFLPLSGLADNLFHAYMVLAEKERERAASIGRGLFEDVLDRIGFEPGDHEALTVSMLREQVLWYAALYGSKTATAFGCESFEALRRGKRIHQDIARSIMKIGALQGDEDTLKWLEDRISASENEHERMNILMALGSFSDASLLERVREYILKGVPDRNKFFPIAALAANPHAVSGLWQWYVSHLEAFEMFHPAHYERVIASIIPFGGLGKEAEVREFFDDYMGKKEKAAEVIKLSLERLEINRRMREGASQAA
jgi:aminopeptidase N